MKKQFTEAFRVAKKLSTTALSQQLPGRLTLWTTLAAAVAVDTGRRCRIFCPQATELALQIGSLPAGLLFQRPACATSFDPVGQSLDRNSQLPGRGCRA